MKTNIIFNHKSVEVPLQVGQWWRHYSGDYYIIVQVTYDQYALVNVSSGLSYSGIKGTLENCFGGNRTLFTFVPNITIDA